METVDIDWSKTHILKTNNKSISSDDLSNEQLHKEIEPWLSAIFQSEHFSLLIGSGLTTGVTYEAGFTAQGMGRLNLTNPLGSIINSYADISAGRMARGVANLEDDLRTSFELLKGLSILSDDRSAALKTEIDEFLNGFIQKILETERNFRNRLQGKFDLREDLLLQIKTAIKEKQNLASIIDPLPTDERSNAETAINYLKAEKLLPGKRRQK